MTLFSCIMSNIVKIDGSLGQGVSIFPNTILVEYHETSVNYCSNSYLSMYSFG